MHARRGGCSPEQEYMVRRLAFASPPAPTPPPPEALALVDSKPKTQLATHKRGRESWSPGQPGPRNGGEGSADAVRLAPQGVWWWVASPPPCVVVWFGAGSAWGGIGRGGDLPGRGGAPRKAAICAVVACIRHELQCLIVRLYGDGDGGSYF